VNASKRRWHLIRESIKFQIKLALDAVRDLMLSPIAMICTVLDLLKGNNKHQGHFQRLMAWGHNTDRWLNLFGDLPVNTDQATASDGVVHPDDEQAATEGHSGDSALSDKTNGERNRVDNNLDKLFSKIEELLDEQQQTGGVTATAKQKIAGYLALLNAKHQTELSQKNSATEKATSSRCKVPKDEICKDDRGSKDQ